MQDFEARFALPDGQVHVWRVALICDPEQLLRLLATLSKDEKARADRFKYKIDKQRFIAARGALRALLAKYPYESPPDLKFEYGQHGKPFLVAPTSLAPQLSFNLSHSNDMAVYAIAQDRQLGIDVEWIRPGFPGKDIANRFFCAREAKELQSIPPDQMAETVNAG